MLELIGFCAVAYLVFKFAPAVLEIGFKFAVVCLGLVAFLFLISIVWGQLILTFAQGARMSELLGFIEDLKMLEALDPVAREAHLEHLIAKYEGEFAQHEEAIARQYDLFFKGTPFKENS